VVPNRLPKRCDQASRRMRFVRQTEKKEAFGTLRCPEPKGFIAYIDFYNNITIFDSCNFVNGFGEKCRS
jgi:hypothetical protein